MKNQETLSLSDLTRELAAALRDVIQETPDSVATESPQDVYEDLASRLVIRLSKRAVVVAPVHCVAAARIFDIFTKWLTGDPKRAYVTRTNGSKFEVATVTPDGLRDLFRGESVQDAYGQAAQTIELNGGEL